LNHERTQGFPHQRDRPAAPLRAWWTNGVTWLLVLVLTAATLYGLFSDRAYRLDRTVHLESMAQGVLTLLVVPLLIWAGRRSSAGSLRGHLVWLGLLGYVAYTYLIYAFGVPHNSAFLLYLTALTLSIAVCATVLWRGTRELGTPAPGWLRPFLWA
jgi:hypothetical protein